MCYSPKLLASPHFAVRARFMEDAHYLVFPWHCTVMGLPREYELPHPIVVAVPVGYTAPPTELLNHVTN